MGSGGAQPTRGEREGLPTQFFSFLKPEQRESDAQAPRVGGRKVIKSTSIIP
jgi:hypothetical protein